MKNYGLIKQKITYGGHEELWSYEAKKNLWGTIPLEMSIIYNLKICGEPRTIQELILFIL